MSPVSLFPVLLLFIFAVPAYGQQQSQEAGQTPIQPPTQEKATGTAARPEFEVASVKVNKSGKGEMIRLEPGIFVAEDATLQRLIMVAYKLRDFQVSGGPSWIDSERFDIEANTDGPSGADPMFLMLQKLLEDRVRASLPLRLKGRADLSSDSRQGRRQNAESDLRSVRSKSLPATLGRAGPAVQ